MYCSTKDAKVQLCDCARRLYERGLVVANDGNLSVRVGEDAVWVTPSGISKGFLTEDMLVKVNLAGEILEGRYKPSSESKMHLALYRALPEMQAVVHAHPPAATSFAVAGLPLDRPILQESVRQLGAVPLVPYALPGTDALAQSVLPYCHTARALLLEFHGAVTWGTSLEKALFRMETLEQTAEVQLHLHTLGSERQLPPELLDAIIDQRAQHGI